MSDLPKIPILDLSPQIDRDWPRITQAMQQVVRSGQFILGPHGRAFEEEAAKYLGVKHAIACNSGTDALIIALRALGIGPGDEVITTPFTFVATAEAISLVGGTVVLADIDPVTLNIDPAQIEPRITPRTKAIIPVHIFGHAADIDAVMAIARKHNLLVLEDVAQAFGGTWRGKQLGSFGQMAAYSFFPSKNLGAFGDGGLMATHDDHLAELARKLRTHGSIRRYHNEMLGYNSRLDELQAAVLRIKLESLDADNEHRRQAAAWYAKHLQGTPGITLPSEQLHAKHVYHQYTIRIAGGKRDAVEQKMTQAGIGTVVYYPLPVHKLQVYSHLKVSMPVAETVAGEVLSLPMGPHVTEAVAQRVASTLKAAL